MFLMHQANQNLIAKVARSLGVSEGKFFSNIRKYGNTSSASMLIRPPNGRRPKASARESRSALRHRSGLPLGRAARRRGVVLPACNP